MRHTCGTPRIRFRYGFTFGVGRYFEAHSSVVLCREYSMLKIDGIYQVPGAHQRPPQKRSPPVKVKEEDVIVAHHHTTIKGRQP